MQVVHTAGLPPSSGRTILPNIGSTTNNRAALRKTASVNAKALYVPLASDKGSWLTSSGAALVSIHRLLNKDVGSCVLYGLVVCTRSDQMPRSIQPRRRLGAVSSRSQKNQL